MEGQAKKKEVKWETEEDPVEDWRPKEVNEREVGLPLVSPSDVEDTGEGQGEGGPGLWPEVRGVGEGGRSLERFGWAWKGFGFLGL